MLEKSARRRGMSKTGDSPEEGNEGEDWGEDHGKHEAQLANLPLSSPKQSMSEEDKGTQEAQPSTLLLRTPKQSKASKSRARRSQNKKNNAKAS